MPNIARRTNLAHTYIQTFFILDSLIVAEDGQQYLLKTQVYKDNNAASEVLI